MQSKARMAEGSSETEGMGTIHEEGTVQAAKHMFLARRAKKGKIRQIGPDMRAFMSGKVADRSNEHFQEKLNELK